MKGLFVVFVSIVFFFLGASSVHAQDTYPYAFSVANIADPWNFFTKNCTSYVAWKMNEGGVSFYNQMQGPNGNSGKFGNAHNWDNNASNIGFVVTSTPSPGDIAVFEVDSRGAGPAGHVMFVESVNSNNTVNVSQYNWLPNSYSYSTRTNIVADKYIKVLSNSCGGNNPILQNMTINSGQTFNCNANNSITLKNFNALNGSNVRLFIN